MAALIWKVLSLIVAVTTTVRSVDISNAAYINPLNVINTDVASFLASSIGLGGAGAGGRWGLGPCPQVTPMASVDLTKTFGAPWFMIAHYSEAAYYERHCHTIRFMDGNPGKDVCRVLVNKTSVPYDSGVVEPVQFSFMLPDDDSPGTWIYNLGKNRRFFPISLGKTTQWSVIVK